MWTENFQMFDLWKGRGTRDQIANIHWIIEKSKRVSGKKIYFCFIDYLKAFYCVDHNKLQNILQETEIPDHLTCFLRNRYAGQEATVRTRNGTDWFQIETGVHQGCLLSPCLFNFYSAYIMWNARLDEAQAGIKIVERNINNVRYADGTTLMAEIAEELKSLLVKVKEEIENKTLNSVLKKKKQLRLWYPVPWLHANRCGNNGKGERLYPLDPKSSGDGDCSHEVKKLLLLGRKDMTNLDSILKSRDITLPTKFHLVKAMIF